ncbi:hypothetical protein Mgra_00006971, partial [Meloidogyne graminicola]
NVPLLYKLYNEYFTTDDLITKWRVKQLIEYLIYRDWICGKNKQSKQNENIYCINLYLNKIWEQLNKYYWYGDEVLTIIDNSNEEIELTVWNIIFNIYLNPKEYISYQLETKIPSYLQALKDALNNIYNKGNTKNIKFENINEWNELLLKNKNINLKEEQLNYLIKRYINKRNLKENINGKKRMHTLMLLKLIKGNNIDYNIEFIRKTIISAKKKDLNLESTSISEISESSLSLKDESFINSNLPAAMENEINEENYEITEDVFSTILQQEIENEITLDLNSPLNCSQINLHFLDYEMKAFINFEDLFNNITNKNIKISEDYLLQ